MTLPLVGWLALFLPVASPPDSSTGDPAKVRDEDGTGRRAGVDTEGKGADC